MSEANIASIIVAIAGLITALTAYLKSRTANKKIDNIIVEKKIETIKKNNGG